VQALGLNYNLLIKTKADTVSEPPLGVHIVNKRQREILTSVDAADVDRTGAEQREAETTRTSSQHQL